ncbi:MAG: hypothetical protein F6K54_16235 [Okeania sp. SIO3B5]|uniref:hypothetical protein n=1 Tax=Okeania sp. SIO3B5 TaxID=2607811 RepID=UPI0013FF5198|nr:hypothetical protein [Okeania sp. SIO3B5]NEO54493.1 hypothetical protein [Okeania sp. SIO3B5]
MQFSPLNQSQSPIIETIDWENKIIDLPLGGTEEVVAQELILQLLQSTEKHRKWKAFNVGPVKIKLSHKFLPEEVIKSPYLLLPGQDVWGDYDIGRVPLYAYACSEEYPGKLILVFYTV